MALKSPSSTCRLSCCLCLVLSRMVPLWCGWQASSCMGTPRPPPDSPAPLVPSPQSAVLSHSPSLLPGPCLCFQDARLLLVSVLESSLWPPTYSPFQSPVTVSSTALGSSPGTLCRCPNFPHCVSPQALFICCTLEQKDAPCIRTPPPHTHTLTLTPAALSHLLTHRLPGAPSQWVPQGCAGGLLAFPSYRVCIETTCSSVLPPSYKAMNSLQVWSESQPSFYPLHPSHA